MPRWQPSSLAGISRYIRGDEKFLALKAIFLAVAWPRWLNDEMLDFKVLRYEKFKQSEKKQ